MGLGAGVDVVLGGDAVGSGDDLRLEAVEPAALAGAASVISAVWQQLTARDARVVAHGHGKGVDDVAGLGVQLFQGVAKGGKQGGQRVGQRVQAAAEAAFVELGLTLVLLQVALAQHRVAAEVAGRYQGRRQHLRVVEATARVRLAGRHWTDTGQ